MRPLAGWAGGVLVGRGGGALAIWRRSMAAVGHVGCVPERRRGLRAPIGTGKEGPAIAGRVLLDQG